MPAAVRGFKSLEDHPSFRPVKELSDKYPRQAAALFQAFSDLTSAQQWREVEAIDVPVANCSLLKGKGKASDEERLVLPIALDEQITVAFLSSVFAGLSPDQDRLLLGIVGPDSSIVYYELKKGIVSPKEVPD